MGQSAATEGALALAAAQAVGALDFDRVHREYWEQDECVFLERFLPPALVESLLVPEVDRLRPAVHRAYLPGHKQSGSVSSYLLRDRAPVFLDLYRAPAFLAFLSHLVQAPVMVCPANDPHACALYFYTEPGDHMGFHYDTSYYKGSRFTVLLGLIQRSAHCRLVCQLYKNRPDRSMRELQLAYGPGDLVIFNGNRLWHAVTPLAAGEERVVLTMEYVTDPEMAIHKRLFSNLKDAFGYFGLSVLFGPRRMQQDRSSPRLLQQA